MGGFLKTINQNKGGENLIFNAFIVSIIVAEVLDLMSFINPTEEQP